MSENLYLNWAIVAVSLFNALLLIWLGYRQIAADRTRSIHANQASVAVGDLAIQRTND